MAGTRRGRRRELAHPRAVPADQAATVLVGPGVYTEEVKVTVPSLFTRGRDRDRVVVDGVLGGIA